MTEESDTFAKLILDEIRLSNTKIDDLRNHIGDKLEGVNANIAKVYTKSERLEVRVEQSEDDIEGLHAVTHGSEHGSNPGLTTQFKLLETQLISIQTETRDAKAQEVVKKAQEKKSSTSIKVAMITAGGAGVLAFLKLLLDLFI